MTLRELITHLDKPVVSGSLDTNIGLLAYDSRKVAPGTAFVALRGTHSDGHDFITKAIASGAAAIIAEQAPPDDVTVPWVHVKQTRIALAQAAAAIHGFPAKNLAILAVTGTNGKTTTAFLMQPAHLHVDSGRSRHQVIGILDPPEPLRVCDFLVAVPVHPVELHQPIAEAASRWCLA